MKQKSPPRGGNHIWDGLLILIHHIYKVMKTTVSKPAQTATPSGAQIRSVGPNTANVWLKNNGKNRNVNQSYVARYAQMMEDGDWVLSPDAIAFDKMGNLLNGQHRLLAIVKSGTSQKFYVAKGLDSKSFDRMDTGRPRSAGQILDMAGFDNYSRLAAVIVLLTAFERQIVSTTFEGYRYSSVPSEVLQYAKQHGELLEDSVRVSDKAYRSGAKLTRPSTLGFIHYAMRHRDESKAWEFIYGLSTGLGVNDTEDARYRLRDRLIRENSGPGKIDRKLEVALVTKAANKFFDGEEVRSMSWRPGAGESFPRPEVGPNYPFGFFE